jgi:hypothetical protein
MFLPADLSGQAAVQVAGSVCACSGQALGPGAMATPNPGGAVPTQPQNRVDRHVARKVRHQQILRPRSVALVRKIRSRGGADGYRRRGNVGSEGQRSVSARCRTASAAAQLDGRMPDGSPSRPAEPRPIDEYATSSLVASGLVSGASEAATVSAKAVEDLLGCLGPDVSGHEKYVIATRSDRGK